MFESGFPAQLSQDVRSMFDTIDLKICNHIQIGQTEEQVYYSLTSGEHLAFPYRIYFLDTAAFLLSSFTQTQQLIYHCVFSRSYNGFVREKHCKAILNTDFPLWAVPYLLKLSDEYIPEILQTIYNGLSARNTDEIKALVFHNLQTFLRSHDRMISYWNEFHRSSYPQYRNYIGRKLYAECFGYTQSMEKLRKKPDFVIK